MVKNIISNFHLKSSFADSEVELFRNLATSILQFSSGVFVDETHGTKSNVEYDSIRGVTERCEISDLLIITVDRDKKLSRATFWQAKKEPKPQWIKNIGGLNISNGCFDFKCQFNQWELLSYRPSVSGVGDFQPPNNILSSFDSASIGSYGVFYQKQSAIELNYSIAEFISSTSLPKVNGKRTKAHPRMSINEKLAKYHYGSCEKIVCLDLNDFVTSLLSLEIGAVVEPGKREHSWLIKYVKEQINSSNNVIYGNGTDRGEDLLPDSEDLPDDMPSCVSGGFSILVISNRS